MTNRSTMRWFDRVQFKVCLFLALVVFVVMVIYSVFGALHMKGQLENETDELLARVEDRTVNSLKGPLWDFNEERTLEVLASEMLDTRIDALLIYDGDGNFSSGIARGNDGQIITLDEGRAVVTAAVSKKNIPIFYEDEDLGMLDIWVSTEFQDIALRTYYIEQAFQGAILAITLALSTFVVLHFLLIRPLSSLTASAESLSKGELDVEIKATSRGEVGAMAKALLIFKSSARENKTLQEQHAIAAAERLSEEEEKHRILLERQEIEKKCIGKSCVVPTSRISLHHHCKPEQIFS